MYVKITRLIKDPYKLFDGFKKAIVFFWNFHEFRALNRFTFVNFRIDK